MIRLDWLRGKFPAMNLDALREIITGLWGPLAPGKRCHYGYAVLEQCGTGAQIEHNEGGDTGDGTCCVNLTGAPLRELTDQQTYDLILAFRELGMTAKRLDAAWDDHKHHITVYDLDKLYKESQDDGDGNLKIAGFQSVRSLASGKHMKNKGGTVEMGRRGSLGAGKFLRVYDKHAESKGKINATRWEIELTGERAAMYFMWLCEAIGPADMTTRLGKIIGGSVDFKIRKREEKHLDRLTQQAWWTQILKKLEAVAFGVPAEATTLQAKLTWIQNALPRSLAMVRRWFTDNPGALTFDNFLRDLLCHGENKMTLLDQLSATNGTLTPVLLTGVLTLEERGGRSAAAPARPDPDDSRPTQDFC